MLDLAISSGLATITFKRASAGNALSSELVERLLEPLPREWNEPGVHTVLLRGEGRHFCSGFDLHGLEDQSDVDLSSLVRSAAIPGLRQRIASYAARGRKEASS